MLKRTLIVSALAGVLLAAPDWMPASAQGQEPRPEGREEARKGPPLPLKAERKIEFTTDEATWLSLDVSPDGKTIVFELLGDLLFR